MSYSVYSEVVLANGWSYSFGAVMEEFEVRDALESIFSTKPELVSPPLKQEGYAMAF